MVIGAKGFTAKVWMFESVDVSGMDTLSRAKYVELVSGEGRWSKEGGEKGFSGWNGWRSPGIFIPAKGFLVGSQGEEGWSLPAINGQLLYSLAEFLYDKL